VVLVAGFLASPMPTDAFFKVAYGHAFMIGVAAFNDSRPSHPNDSPRVRTGCRLALWSARARPACGYRGRLGLKCARCHP
jgi:hypothetical protein